ncbi:hypothetical protein ACN9ML_08615 [Dyadobacter endophyticus]|uniref:hypothetical protein n=1 Tax=Dyadobacter endophyticus TaxID=1749036 RepID=UPI003CFB8EC3
MKRLLHTALLLWLALSTGCKDRDELNVMDDQGLGLYWHHEADGERGRHLLMSFINEKPSTDKFDYKFDFEVQGRVIDVRLVEKIPRGKCPVFPSPSGDQCHSWGNIYIPESALSDGTYQFRLQTGKAIVTSELVVGRNQYEMKVPVNPYFTNNIPFVYAIPKNIVFGSISYFGLTDGLLANALIDDLTNAGLEPANVPVHPYQYLREDQLTHLSKSFSEPDSYRINLVFSWDGDFEKVAEICKKHFELSKKRLGIGLWHSNFMEQINGEQYGTFSVYLR